MPVPAVAVMSPAAAGLSSKDKSIVWDFGHGENTWHQTRSVTLYRDLHRTVVRAGVLVPFKLSVSV